MLNKLNTINMNLQEAMQVVTDNLKNNKELRQVWVSNIAMAYKDTYGQYQKTKDKLVLNKEDRHIVSNDAAEYFVKLLCGEIYNQKEK